MIKTIKITPQVAQRGLQINQLRPVVVFHNNNFYGSITKVGSEVFSTSKVSETQNINDLQFVDCDNNQINFEIGV